MVYRKTKNKPIKYDFKAEVDWDALPEWCCCDYTCYTSSCLPVTIKYKIDGTEYSEEFIVSSSVCDELETGYMSALEFYSDVNRGY